MKKTIGYIFWGIEKGLDKSAFERIAKKKNIELVTFNLSDILNEEEIEEKAKKCDIIFNNSGEDFAIELVKTLEKLGKKVVESSETYYYSEDKWMFYLTCKKNNIPTPESILLSESLDLASEELKKFACWPVILKRVEGSCGDYVEKADNLKESIKIIKEFWKKGSERLPIIAQEFVPSSSYRMTVIGDEIAQTAIKESTGWKHTGVSSERFRKLKVDDDLKKITKKIIEVTEMKICGIDFLKKDEKWLALEINSSPGFGFFDNHRDELVEKILNFLVNLVNKKINK